MFSPEFSEISKNTFFTEHFWATALVSDVNLLSSMVLTIQIIFANVLLKKLIHLMKLNKKLLQKINSISLKEA